MKIILTGASGFLGQHIADYFANEEVIKLGRQQGDIIVQLDSEVPVLPPADLVIHAAGKAHHVPRTAAESEEFYKVNVKGTENLLRGVENSGTLPKSFIFISSIAVYGLDTGTSVNEDSPLMAKEPYGHSKILAEALIEEWCNKHGIPYTILRLPLLAGSNAPGNLKAMIKGIKRGYYFNFAKGRARKSMLMASSIPSILLPSLEAPGIYNLTDGYHPSFSELSTQIAMQLGTRPPGYIPGYLAQPIAMVGNLLGKRFPLNKKNYKKMINDLTFDDSKARSAFGWNPTKVIDEFKI